VASTRFTVLTGHLSQYSLADLIGILRHQRKTGRLLIEYIGSPAILFFKDGDLVDAQYNTLIGVQAIFVAFVQPPASFNFNPLMQPSRYSIDFEQQRVILELLGCWTEDMAVVKSTERTDDTSVYEVQVPELNSPVSQLLIAPSRVDKGTELIEADEVLALPPGPVQNSTRPISSRRPLILALATFVLLLVFGVPTLIAISNKVRKPMSMSVAPAPGNVPVESGTTPPVIGDVSQLSTQVGTASTTSSVEQKRDHGLIANDSRVDKGAKDVLENPAPPKDTAQSNPSADTTQPTEKTKTPSTSGQTVKVVMQIENGRVVQASVGDRRPGSEAYEALALRIARQRRYPAGVNKQETLIMKVDGPK
jgi:hypothetical protein